MPFEIKVIRRDGSEELHAASDHVDYNVVPVDSEAARRRFTQGLPRLRPGIYITLYDKPAVPGEKQLFRKVELTEGGEVVYIVNAETKKNAKVLSWLRDVQPGGGEQQAHEEVAK